MLDPGFSKMMRPPPRLMADKMKRERPWISEDSWTESCRATEFEGTPSKNSGVLTGRGPGRVRVALECLQQNGAATPAPMSPDSASIIASKNLSSSSKSWPWMMSMGSNMSTRCFLPDVLTGAFAPEKRSRKNRGLQETPKTWAYLQELPLLHFPVWYLMQMPRPSGNLRAHESRYFLVSEFAAGWFAPFFGSGLVFALALGTAGEGNRLRRRSSFCKDSSENAAICFSCQRVSGYTTEHGIHASKWNDKCSQLFSICACHSDTCIGIWVGSTIFHTPPLQFEVWLTLQPILDFHLSNASFRATVWICILSSEENVYEFLLKSSGFGCFQHTA